MCFLLISSFFSTHFSIFPSSFFFFPFCPPSSLLLDISPLFLLPPVSISPPDAGPQLCGIPVLLPTWAERLFPPGPPPGANNRAVPGQHQPLPHIQPQQQVGRTPTTAGNYDYESWWTLTSWFHKFGLQALICLQPYCKCSVFRSVVDHRVVGEQGLRRLKKTGFSLRLSITLGQQPNVSPTLIDSIEFECRASLNILITQKSVLNLISTVLYYQKYISTPCNQNYRDQWLNRLWWPCLLHSMQMWIFGSLGRDNLDSSIFIKALTKETCDIQPPNRSQYYTM